MNQGGVHSQKASVSLRRGGIVKDPILPGSGLHSHLALISLPHPQLRCEGWDSNPRTPARTDLKSAGFGQACLPSLSQNRPYGI